MRIGETSQFTWKHNQGIKSHVQLYFTLKMQNKMLKYALKLLIIRDLKSIFTLKYFSIKNLI